MSDTIYTISMVPTPELNGKLVWSIEQNTSTESPPKKRQYMLISRKMITIQNPSPKSNSRPSPPSKQVVAYVEERLPPFVISHRLCLVCSIIKPVSEMTILMDDIEKLFIVISALHRRQLLVTNATYTYVQSPFHMCSSHFGEASSEILKMFGVKSAERIFNARPQKVSQVEKYVKYFTGNCMERNRLSNNAYAFIMNHPEVNAVVGPVVQEEDIPYEETIECNAVMETAAIVPKCFRQPRKQRFDDEEAGCSSSMLRIIKREPLHLPTDQVPNPSFFLENLLKCCYCFELHERKLMLHIPTTQNRITTWVNHLGEEFGQRLKKNEINFMCRKHFSTFDFSPHGRLRRGALPNFVPQSEVHTFKIDGDEFVKVSESGDRIDDNSDIDIEN